MVYLFYLVSYDPISILRNVRAQCLCVNSVGLPHNEKLWEWKYSFCSKWRYVANYTPRQLLDKDRVACTHFIDSIGRSESGGEKKVPTAVGNRTSIIHRCPEQSCFPASSVPSVALTNRLFQLQCCGIDGPTDYRRYGSLDSSCCLSTNQHEGWCHSVQQRGCLVSLTNDIQERMLWVSVVSILAAILQVNMTQTLPSIEPHPALCCGGIGAMCGV